MDKEGSDYNWIRLLTIGFGIASVGVALAVVGLLLKSR